MRRILGLILALYPTLAAARVSLGTFENWGAFRDAQPARCFAIAEPVRSGTNEWRPFLSIATWPAAAVRGQFHARLSRQKLPAAPVTLIIGSRRLPLTGGGVDVWAPEARSDAAIVAAMRGARSLSISTRSSGGTPFVDTYLLNGAATAIDAINIGCGRR